MGNAILLIALVLGCGDEESPAASCVAGGGEVITRACCAATEDFPDTCSEGPCGCTPGESHQVDFCLCPLDSCWDGSGCVGFDTGPLPS